MLYMGQAAGANDFDFNLFHLRARGVHIVSLEIAMRLFSGVVLCTNDS
jgi:hypothetical protein